MDYKLITRRGKVVGTYQTLAGANRKLMQSKGRWGRHEIIDSRGKVFSHPYDIHKTMKRKRVQNLFGGFRL